MPRYIDADKIKLPDEIPPDPSIESYFAGMFSGWNNALRECRKRIDSAQTVSPDEVCGLVHCGKCSHADKDLPGAIYCTMWDAWEVPEDGFCYKGAKMEVSEDA